jgi:hypothetical protein
VRLPRRCTLRTLMVAVALAGLAAWGFTLQCRSVDRRRSAEFAAKARLHERLLTRYAQMLDDIDFAGDRWVSRRKPGDVLDGERASVERRMKYEYGLYEKYRRASSFPWLPVDPDPIAPPVISRWAH